MSTNPEDPQYDAPSRDLTRALDLITAVANRDTAPEDVVAQLRREGYDALDVVVSALMRAVRQPDDERAAQRPVDVRSFSQPTPPELVSRTVHQVPKVPFLMNGTLYDPEDVRRFDGQELHFVSAPGRDLIAFDDKNVIAKVWELSFVAPSFAGTTGAADESRYPSRDEIARDVFHNWPPTNEIGAYFYEHAGPDWGSTLFLRPNHGYWDLRQVGLGFLGLSDWNDKISAVQLKNYPNHALVCVMHEHINMTGTTLSLIGNSESTLGYLGWNDRASSVECW